MRKNKKIIVANWKMNPSSASEAKEKCRKIKNIARKLKNTKTIICPSFVFLSELSRNISGSTYVCGAQDVFEKSSGAYTGEISPLQLLSLGVEYVLIGHSERRSLGEDDLLINRKIRNCLNEGLNVILCVGEKERDQEGRYFESLALQIKQSLDKVNARDILETGHGLGQSPRVLIAYEPLWAIGVQAKGADTPDALFEMVIFIRKTISDFFTKKVAMQVPILYGGSVDDKNAQAFLENGGVQGLLVGRASLDPKIFGAILKIADKIKI